MYLLRGDYANAIMSLERWQGLSLSPIDSDLEIISLVSDLGRHHGDLY